MGKRRKLTEVEEFYVRHNPENLTRDEMAIKMSCNVNILDGMLDMDKVAVKATQVDEPTPTIKQNANNTAKPYKETLFSKSMGRRKGRGVAIATEAASQIADATREFSKKNKYAGSVHKPIGDGDNDS